VATLSPPNIKNKNHNIMNIFIKFKAFLQLREAVKKADKAHEEDGERYYVLPTNDGKLIVMDRKNFRILKKKHYINRNSNIRDLVEECFYCTPYRDGSMFLTEKAIEMKRQQFYSWKEAYRKMNKARKHPDNKKG
jgi:glutaredoxin-related protein